MLCNNRKTLSDMLCYHKSLCVTSEFLILYSPKLAQGVHYWIMSSINSSRFLSVSHQYNNNIPTLNLTLDRQHALHYYFHQYFKWPFILTIYVRIYTINLNAYLSMIAGTPPFYLYHCLILLFLTTYKSHIWTLISPWWCTSSTLLIIVKHRSVDEPMKIILQSKIALRIHTHKTQNTWTQINATSSQAGRA